MARPPLHALDTLELLRADSLLFINENAGDNPDGRAEDGRENGLDDAGSNANGDALGLTIAVTARDGTSVEPDHPGGPFSLSFKIEIPVHSLAGGSAITMLEPSLMGGRGGVPGPNGEGGGGNKGGDTGGDTLLKEYFAGNYDGAAGYDIWIEFKGDGWTVEMQNLFIQMAEYFTGTQTFGDGTTDAVITEDIGGGGRYRGKIIDDLYVTAEISYIDGPGAVLGRAGPTAVWTATDLTATGTIQFDTADALNYFNLGLLDDIITHELVHVLGFGTLWDYGSHNLVDGSNYTGAAGNAAYDGNPSTFLQIEQDGGPGTAGGHWDEITYDNELMTGYIDNDGDPSTNDDNVLSEWTVLSLADLGYSINYQDYPYDDLAIG